MSFGEGVARAQHVAVEVDAALGDAGRAAGERNQRRIVLSGGDGGERRQIGGAAFKRTVAVIAVIFDDMLEEAGLLRRVAKIADEAAVADRMADFGLVDDGRHLARGEAAAWW